MANLILFPMFSESWQKKNWPKKERKSEDEIALSTKFDQMDKH